MEDKPKAVINFHQMELDDRILKVSDEKQSRIIWKYKVSKRSS